MNTQYDFEYGAVNSPWIWQFFKKYAVIFSLFDRDFRLSLIIVILLSLAKEISQTDRNYTGLGE